jgi:hypothetical protein
MVIFHSYVCLPEGNLGIMKTSPFFLDSLWPPENPSISAQGGKLVNRNHRCLWLFVELPSYVQNARVSARFFCG